MGTQARFQSGFFATIGQKELSSGSRTNSLLNTGYTHKGGAGSNAIGIRYYAQSATSIDELYLFMDAHGGTIGNITCECKIYNESTASIPGITLLDTSTAVVIPAGDDAWIKVTFGTPYTPAVGDIVWFVFYNTSGAPATDYPQIMTNNATSTSALTSAGTRVMRMYTTTDGFTTGLAATGNIAIVKQAGGTAAGIVVGYPFTIRNTAPNASNTRKRGMVINTLVADLSIEGVVFPILAGISSIQVFVDDAAPDSPDQTWNTGSIVNQTSDELIGFKFLPTPYVMLAGHSYRWVYTLASASTGPTVLQIEDYATYSSVFDEIYGNLNVQYQTIDDGSNGWTDSKAYCAASTMLLIGEQVAASGGGRKWLEL